jgi:hypothetical protein
LNGSVPARLLALAVFAWPTSEARAEGAEPVARCVEAYERGQEQRKSGQLIAARDTLQRCARDECPSFIRADCINWYGEVQGEVPTLVFAARSSGRDVVDVRVTLGERVLAARIDGQVVELDPGEYDFQFEGAGQSVLQRFVIARGERNRLIQVEMSGPPLTPSGDARPPSRTSPRSLVVPSVFIGVGVAGLAGFAGLAAWGRSSESKLELSCSPRCSEGRVASVKRKYLLADASLGVGVVALAFGTYFFLRDEQVPPQQAGGLELAGGPHGANVVYGGSF